MLVIRLTGVCYPLYVCVIEGIHLLRARINFILFYIIHICLLIESKQT